MRTACTKAVALALSALAVTMLFTGVAHAADLHQAAQSYQGLLDLIQSQAHSWNGRLLGYAKELFWGLAVIQLVWTVAPPPPRRFGRSSPRPLPTSPS